ncbi:MAG TPA: Ig domain-containing protein [Acidimicrobiales bacterium]|nr:Ig domain-containing protein [Acidimicrobiales bacterium]
MRDTVGRAPVSHLTVIAAAAVLAVVSTLVPSATAVARTSPTTSTPHPGAVASSVLSQPTAGHAYRHGALPLRDSDAGRAAAPLLVPASSADTTEPAPHNLGVSIRGEATSGGGPVVTGTPHVYLVFWGSQWGTETTTGGYDHFSGDPDGLAPDLEAFFAGLGTDNELWSAIATQYCDGVRDRTKTCPLSPTADHVGYPTPVPSILPRVWEDTSYTPTVGTFPGQEVAGASAVQIAREAAKAAAHLGDTSQQAQFFIVSPHFADPDGWLDPTDGYCAYHDDTGVFRGEVTGPRVEYTNFPYVPDAGTEACSSTGKAGLLDGVTETASHEYVETQTDPYPASGWTDARGEEVADKCEYLSPGQPGAATYLTLATGTFDVQGIWANDSGKKGGCETAHAPIYVTAPSKQKSVVGSPVSLAVSAFDVRGSTPTYGATRLPAGLAINHTTGVITGTPVGHAHTRVTVTASETLGSTSAAFTWVVTRH